MHIVWGASRDRPEKCEQLKDCLLASLGEGVVGEILGPTSLKLGEGRRKFILADMRVTL